ncbi:hypothetical protein [sulfur-oxidizing endosymbiont of Gigantopelta aegis]|uniref:hypothetical protein n=1 Tax=sulfur-oxidizing endosymbiont of Gigantopelta aegis TaxID=2794934 RepID=UPI001BE49EE9|nr:hypothetical protein [sulfur-oxidizing endosymbiont of Gigantopelta aegis]
MTANKISKMNTAETCRRCTGHSQNGNIGELAHIDTTVFFLPSKDSIPPVD